MFVFITYSLEKLNMFFYTVVKKLSLACTPLRSPADGVHLGYFYNIWH